MIYSGLHSVPCCYERKMLHTKVYSPSPLVETNFGFEAIVFNKMIGYLLAYCNIRTQTYTIKILILLTRLFSVMLQYRHFLPQTK